MLEAYDDILTIPEVADILKIGTSQTYKIVRSGQLKGFKEGKDWKIPKNCLIAYIKQKISYWFTDAKIKEVFTQR